MTADSRRFALSLKDGENCWNRLPVTNLFGGCSPSVQDIAQINWSQPGPCSPLSLTEQREPKLHGESDNVPAASKTIHPGDQAFLQSSAETRKFHASTEQSQTELHMGTLTDSLVIPSSDQLVIPW